jgi:glutathione synthase/RimK-type ligase-like ATP-grasp enzyme
MIVILSVGDDLHALVVQKHVRAAGADCHIVECDRIAQKEFLNYGINYPVEDEVLTSEDRWIPLSDASVMWLRRMRSEQTLEFAVPDDGARAVINSDCSGALTGLLATHFHGTWLSTPEATARAADKLGQLKVALECGFRVPRTLVSQSRDAILAFHESCGANVVVKTIVGAPGPFLQTVRLDDPRSLDEASFAAAPAIFQECIEGCEHVRLNCFGNASHAALIRTQDLDWRVNLDVPITPYAVPQPLHRKVRTVLDHLGLEMGVVDLKLTPEQEPVWLEVNPQGQFLFLDAFTDLHLGEQFAAYLIAEEDGRG